jgi:hypothetical protein
VAGVIVLLVFLSGCFFNIFQTAQTVGAGHVALTLGAAAMNMAVGQQNSLVFTPQGRLTVGLSDNVDLGIQSGAMVGTDGSASFLGAVADLKARLVNINDGFALALGIGGGYSPGLVGWGLEGSVYLDSNIRFLPIYVVYRPLLPLAGSTLTIANQFAVGLALHLSPTARLLLEADWWNGLPSIGAALEVSL